MTLIKVKNNFFIRKSTIEIVLDNALLVKDAVFIVRVWIWIRLCKSYEKKNAVKLPSWAGFISFHSLISTRPACCASSKWKYFTHLYRIVNRSSLHRFPKFLSHNSSKTSWWHHQVDVKNTRMAAILNMLHNALRCKLVPRPRVR